MTAYTKKDFLWMASRRLDAFQQIAKRLGKDHPITKMMGSRAWGRHKDETGSQPDLRAAVLEVGSLDGAFDVLNLWARDNDPKAQRVMGELYPTNFFSVGK